MKTLIVVAVVLLLVGGCAFKTQGQKDDTLKRIDILEQALTTSAGLAGPYSPMATALIAIMAVLAEGVVLAWPVRKWVQTAVKKTP